MRLWTESKKKGVIVMNMVMLDGIISSTIEAIPDARRSLARFMIATREGTRVGVEVRGESVGRMARDWRAGDTIHVRGRLTTAGYVAVDLVRRMKEKRQESLQTALPLFRSTDFFQQPLFS
jgi:hypothetical protein